MSDSKHMMQFKINHLFRKVQSKDDEIERFSKYTAELEANNKQVRKDLLLYVDSNVELQADNERLQADCTALMRIAEEAYDADDLGMTFNDWLDMNGYRFDNKAL